MSNNSKLSEETTANDEAASTEAAPPAEENTKALPREVARALVHAQRGLEHVARWLDGRAEAVGALARKLSPKNDSETPPTEAKA